MKPRRLIVGGGLKEIEKLLVIMSKRSIMDMRPGDECIGYQQVEEVPLAQVRGRITSFIGCLDNQGNCAVCPGCWEYFGDLQYMEDLFELEESLDFLDFDTQFEQVELKHRRKAADKLAKQYLGEHGIIGIYASTEGDIKVFIKGDMETAKKLLPDGFMGCNIEVIQSTARCAMEVTPTAPCGPMESFDD